MVITTGKSFSPEGIKSFPKAQPRKTQKGGRKRKSAILTDTPGETAFEEKANSAKTRKATEACKKLILNKEPVSTVSSKVESAKKGMKKGKDTKIHAQESDEDKEFKICLVYCEHFSDNRPGDDWAHELCTTGGNIFIGPNCHSDNDLD